MGQNMNTNFKMTSLDQVQIAYVLKTWSPKYYLIIIIFHDF